MSNSRYRNITQLHYSDISSIKITTHVPKPSEFDYKSGYIRRYFVRKSNDENSPIYEVSSSEYSKVVSRSNYIGVSIKWRISGPKSETLKNSVLDKGVKESNRIAIQLVSDKIPNLKFMELVG